MLSKKGKLERKTCEKRIAPMNCLVLKMVNGKEVKLWLEMDVINRCIYCVLHTDISKRLRRIDIDREMGKYMEEIKLEEWAE